MAVGVMSIPSFQRADTLPDVPGDSPSSDMARAVSMISCRSHASSASTVIDHLRIEAEKPFKARITDAPLGDQPGDKPCRRHIEGRVRGGAARCGDVDGDKLAVAGTA